MKHFLRLIVIASACTMISCGVQKSAAGVDANSGIVIEWDQAETAVAWGGYPRVHRLNDGRLMLVFFSGGGSSYCLSEDNGTTWSEPVAEWKSFDASGETGTTGVMVDNPEFAQLPAAHHSHPGRIIFATNLRPRRGMSSIYPYSIAVSLSDDNGAVWSDITPVFQSSKWNGNAVAGCWEPFVNVLPDGTVQIYFSDETPYFSDGHKFQNISVVESHDGGDTWGEVRQIAYTKGFRDGMPVVTMLHGRLYLAIEHNAPHQKLHPQIIICNESDNWPECAGGRSPARFNPLASAPDWSDVYAGAPYLIRTDNYLVLSYQSSEGAQTADHTHAVMEVVACPISEIGPDGKFNSMHAASRPFEIDQTTGSALWNSLCDLGGDWILAVSSTPSGICLRRGHISGK